MASDFHGTKLGPRTKGYRGTATVKGPLELPCRGRRTGLILKGTYEAKSTCSKLLLLASQVHARTLRAPTFAGVDRAGHSSRPEQPKTLFSQFYCRFQTTSENNLLLYSSRRCDSRYNSNLDRFGRKPAMLPPQNTAPMSLQTEHHESSTHRCSQCVLHTPSILREFGVFRAASTRGNMPVVLTAEVLLVPAV